MIENLHIAMVMDGNRRYGEKSLNNKLQGHSKGAENLQKVIDWSLKSKLKILTLYTFSTENFNRTEEEVNELFNLFRKYFKEFTKKEDELKEKGIKIKFIGKLELFPLDLQEIMNELTAKTAQYDNLTINFCMGYGGHQEIIDAVNKAIELGNKINEEDFEQLLYLKEKPDIVLRTGGNVRTSNFLPWQTAYSEWYFLEEMWPELTPEKLDWIIEDFSKRKRNFGK